MPQVFWNKDILTQKHFFLTGLNCLKAHSDLAQATADSTVDYANSEIGNILFFAISNCLLPAASSDTAMAIAFCVIENLLIIKDPRYMNITKPSLLGPAGAQSSGKDWLWIKKINVFWCFNA